MLVPLFNVPTYMQAYETYSAYKMHLTNFVAFAPYGRFVCGTAVKCGGIFCSVEI